MPNRGPRPLVPTQARNMSEAPKGPRQGFSAVPVFGDILAMIRLLRDRDAAWWAKVLVVATLAYVVCPLDLIPDFTAPVVAWLDDLGLLLALRLALHTRLLPYRYPLFGERREVRAAL